MQEKSMQAIRDSLLSHWVRMGRSSYREIDTQNELCPVQSEMMDMAQTLEQVGLETSLQRVNRRKILAIEKALAKMSTGNFGVCEDCKQEIGWSRLMVLPEARLCACCQTYEERQNARCAFLKTDDFAM